MRMFVTVLWVQLFRVDFQTEPVLSFGFHPLKMEKLFRLRRGKQLCEIGLELSTYSTADPKEGTWSLSAL